MRQRTINPSLNQKIRLVGFAMSLDQLQSELKADDSDTLLNLGDHDQLRIVGAGAEIASSIQILDRGGAWPGAPDSSTRFPVKYAID